MNRYPTLSGETLVVPIVGDPIAQVKSPDGITALFAERGVNAVVVPLQIAAADLDALLTGLSPSASVSGLIATVPHKFGLAAHCATLTDRARFLGSVNVARRNPDGTWHGDQVDGAAFVAALPANPEGRRALQVGAGGAGSAIALALLEAGVAELRLHDADAARRDALVERLRERFGARVHGGRARPRRRRPRRQRHTDGHAGRRPLPGRRHAAEARHGRRRRRHQARGAAADRGRPGGGCATSTGSDMFGRVAVPHRRLPAGRPPESNHPITDGASNAM